MGMWRCVGEALWWPAGLQRRCGGGVVAARRRADGLLSVWVGAWWRRGGGVWAGLV